MRAPVSSVPMPPVRCTALSPRTGETSACDQVASCRKDGEGEQVAGEVSSVPAPKVDQLFVRQVQLAMVAHAVAPTLRP